jgi:surfeit locus 1 family protein
LGRWQLNRAAEKEALQASMDAPSGKHLVDAAALLASTNPASLVYQHALLRGQWLADQTVYLDNRQMHAKVGFFAVTPLRLNGSDQLILVQRGWVARNFEERTKVPGIETPGGLVTLEGRIAPLPGKLIELGTPSVTAIRQNLDLQQFHAQTRLPVLPVILVQTGPASEGLLRDWPAVNTGVEKHYGYALQWFGIAVAMALLYLWHQIFKPYTLRTKDSKPHA